MRPSQIPDNQEWRVFIASYITYSISLPGVITFRKVLDVDESNPNNITRVQTWEYAGLENQWWWIRPAGYVNGQKTYTLRNFKYNKYLAFNSAGQTILSDSPHGFYFVEGSSPRGIPYFNIYLSGSTSEVLDVNSYNREDGATVSRWDFNNGDNQRWLLVNR